MTKNNDFSLEIKQMDKITTNQQVLMPKVFWWRTKELASFALSRIYDGNCNISFILIHLIIHLYYKGKYRFNKMIQRFFFIHSTIIQFSFLKKNYSMNINLFLKINGNGGYHLLKLSVHACVCSSWPKSAKHLAIRISYKYASSPSEKKRC